MELKTYLQIISARKGIVLVTLLLTLLAALVLTARQTPLYESSATYVVGIRLRGQDERTLTSALGTLQNPEVVGTFVEVANSQRIKSLAADELGLTAEQRRQLTVNSRPIVGTNVIEIVVLGPDPTLVRDFASAIGARTAVNVQGLYDMYDLQLLDEASTPDAPVRPNVVLNLVLGALVGFFLGAGLAFLATYLAAPIERAPISGGIGHEVRSLPNDLPAEPPRVIASER